MESSLQIFEGHFPIKKGKGVRRKEKISGFLGMQDFRVRYGGGVTRRFFYFLCFVFLIVIFS